MITFILAVCGNVDYVYSFPQSPPSRAAWIEMSMSGIFCAAFLSPPSRAAWIEMFRADKSRKRRLSRRLHGRRGLKFAFKLRVRLKERRRLHGRRGLKFIFAKTLSLAKSSPPSRAAWIEIQRLPTNVISTSSPPSRAAWIEIRVHPANSCTSTRSPPSRAAWIEIPPKARFIRLSHVAAFTGGVD